MTLPALVQVALGGAIGACLRYGAGLASLRLFGAGFPFGTLFVNVAGSFVIGGLAALMFLRGSDALSGWQPLLMTGILGGFTTFSSFSVETLDIFQRGQIGLAASYVLLSVGLSLAAVYVGWLAGRGVFA